MNTPDIFKPRHPFPYPPNNLMIFEEWYGYVNNRKFGRIYLDVYWTSYHCLHNFGKNKFYLQRLQQYIDSLDRSKRYYTIVQYDDGCLVDFKDLDVLVFTMSGGTYPKTYPLPLLCMPHPYNFTKQKTLLYSFIGRETHPIRNAIFTSAHPQNTYISQRPTNIRQYCNILAKSVFSLCPRGYGISSFRICESMQYDAIPVYISDEFSIPHHDFSHGILADSFQDAVCKIRDMPQKEISERQRLIHEKYFKEYTYEANQRIIYKVLETEI